LDGVLKNVVDELQRERPSWVEVGQEAMHRWLGKHLNEEILMPQRDPAHLIGPGYALGLLIQAVQSPFREERDISHYTSEPVFPEEIGSIFRRRLHWIQERVSHLILRQSLPSIFQERVHEMLDADREFEDFKERASSLLALAVSDPPMPSFWGFKVRQSLTYGLLLVFFILAIGGQEAWKEAILNPGAASTLALLVSFTHTIFSAKGLAALGSYALLNLLFGFRFYRGYRRRLQRAAKEALDALKVALVKEWERNLEGTFDHIDHLRADIKTQIESISRLKGDGQTQ
jgi:hypothetical protein